MFYKSPQSWPEMEKSLEQKHLKHSQRTKNNYSNLQLHFQILLLPPGEHAGMKNIYHRKIPESSGLHIIIKMKQIRMNLFAQFNNFRFYPINIRMLHLL